MKRIDHHRIEDLNIAYIGGGSRGWAWGLMRDLAMDGQLQGTVRLYDIDREAARRNQIIGERISAHPGAQSRWNYCVADSLQEALAGADFVIISILPGTFEEMRADVHLPERVGVYQSVGDTTGPGGLMRALRTVPMFEEIGRAIRAFAPDAWVVNYTNPMALCVATLYAVHPGIHAFGCCHEVFGTQKLLCRALEEMAGIGGVDRHELYTTVTGVNHFTWLTRAGWKDVDLMPLYDAFARRHWAEGYDEGGDDNWMNSHFKCAHRVKFDLYLRFGAIAAAGDRHLAEFMPPWYLKDPETVRRWKFSLTPVSWRIDDLAERMKRSDALIDGRLPIDLTPSGEEGHLLIKAILGLGDLVSNVNVPNAGQVPDLPLGTVVETNALFGLNRLEPVFAGPLPASLKGLITRHALQQQVILKAALTRDRALAFAAFMQDPLMASVSCEDGQALFDDMLEAQRAYLPEGWLARRTRV